MRGAGRPHRLEGGRAVGVEVAGSPVRARRAVLADVDADVLYRRLVGDEHLPAATLAALDRFQRSWATVKVDWALRTPIPWNDPSVGTAGTVHLAASIDELAVMAAAVSGSADPRRPVRRARPDDHDRPDPFAPGTESAWAYTHVPAVVRDGDGRHPLSPAEVASIADRIEARVEEHAPGFRDRILVRHVLGPAELERRDANLVDGDNAGGTNQMHQQLVFRPLPGRAGPHAVAANSSAVGGAGA